MSRQSTVFIYAPSYEPDMKRQVEALKIVWQIPKPADLLPKENSETAASNNK